MGKREQWERKMKIGDKKTERQKWNRGLEGGREMDNDDWTSAVHNRAIGWREAELMREVHMRWRERERDGRGEEYGRWVHPGSSLQAPEKSRDEQTELAPGPFDYAIVNHLLSGFVCLFLDRC